MASLSSCPACNTTLSLFTPREISHHINACLDSQRGAPQSRHLLPRCPVCDRDLSELTVAAGAEHENRCVDNLNPRPERKTSRVKSSLVPRRPRSPPKPISEDKRVRRFLELLGLDRYTQRFADEEIDFPALRLLEDTDFAHLRIPDAARRRIADALTAVPILEQIEGAQTDELAADPAVVVPTQRFGTSRLAGQMRRNKPMVQLDDSDGEYAPTPVVECSPDHARSTSGKGSQEQETAGPKEIANNEDRSGRLSGDGEPDYFEDIERAVKSRNVAPTSESSDVSSFASDPEDLSEVLRSTSKITVELKLQKWRKKQIEREKNRHQCELQRIETEYMKLVNSTKTDEDHPEGDVTASLEGPKFPDPNCDTIDLTEDISDEQNAPEASTKEGLERSIVISSNESIPKPASAQNGDSQNIQRADDCVTQPQKGSQRDACTLRTPPRPESPFIETHTPQQSEKKTSSQEEEEVIDLISAEKKRGTKQPLNEAVSRSENVTASLFAPTPNGDSLGETRQNSCESDEDFMDLLGVGKENTRSSSRPTSAAEDVHKRSSTESDSNTIEEAPSQSRLKKRLKKGKSAKATSQDISQLIRMDKALYDDILLMESVPFDRIFSRLRGGEKHVTKKALYHFLQDEGILFKGDSVEPGSQQESYLRHLNSDMCQD